MIRHLATVASALSLLMCAATVVAWVRSYYHDDQFFSLWLSRWLHGLSYVGSNAGIAHLTVESGGDGLGPTRTLAEWSYLGVHFVKLQQGSLLTRDLACHYASLLIAFAALPLARCLATIVSRPRYDNPRCRSCGYDVRATPDRCPECGTVTAKNGSRLP
jgi:hypothetical protein